MKLIYKIAKIELQKFFYSPIAWLVMFLLATHAGVSYMNILMFYLKSSALSDGLVGSHTTLIYNSGAMGWLSRHMLPQLYLYVPLVTMGIFSKEFSTGTIKLLYSSPISNFHIVIGKYLSTVVFSLLLTSILFVISLSGFYFIKDFDFSVVLSGLLGIFLLLCTYSAIGLFMSSLTSYQVVAAIGSFAVFFVLKLVGNLWQDVELIRGITYWLSINGRVKQLISGLITSAEISYFVLIITLFVSFTIFRIKGLREKTQVSTSVIRYICAFVLMVVLGYFTSLPSLNNYCDTTSTKRLTLTNNTQEILNKIDGDVTITSYVNAFNGLFRGEPKIVSHDKKRFDKYRRFIPNLKMEYKYYYAKPVAGSRKYFDEQYAGLTEEEILAKICEISDLDTEMFKPASSYPEVDLESESNRFVRRISINVGKSSMLRYYDDRIMYPLEGQITAAFKKIVSDTKSTVAFITGHGERSIHDSSLRGINMFACDKAYRWSLINNGFDVIEYDLSQDINKNIDILVIAESKKNYTPLELKHLKEYVEAGVNIVITSDRNRQEILNPVVKEFDVKFLDGQVVENNGSFSKDLVTSDLKKETSSLSYYFAGVNRRNGCVTMPGAVAITHDVNNDFEIKNILTSDNYEKSGASATKGSWNELETTNFIDNIPVYNPAKGEVAGALSLGVTLTRKLNEKEQRIIILGDTDFMSNRELSEGRKGINAQNQNFILGIFHWMSYGEYPIDTRREASKDDDFLVKKSEVNASGVFVRFAVPFLFILLYMLIWFRRRGR